MAGVYSEKVRIYSDSDPSFPKGRRSRPHREDDRRLSWKPNINAFSLCFESGENREAKYSRLRQRRLNEVPSSDDQQRTAYPGSSAARTPHPKASDLRWARVQWSRALSLEKRDRRARLLLDDHVHTRRS